EALGVLRVERVALRLEEGALVPVEAEPPEALEVLVHRRLSRAFPIGVLEPEHEAAAVVAREEPVEEGGSRAPDVQVARRTGRKAGTDRHPGDLTAGVRAVKLLGPLAVALSVPLGGAARDHCPMVWLGLSAGACILPRAGRAAPPTKGGSRSRCHERRFSSGRTTRTTAASWSTGCGRSASSTFARRPTARRPWTRFAATLRT